MGLGRMYSQKKMPQQSSQRATTRPGRYRVAREDVGVGQAGPDAPDQGPVELVGWLGEAVVDSIALFSADNEAADYSADTHKVSRDRSARGNSKPHEGSRRRPPGHRTGGS